MGQFSPAFCNVEIVRDSYSQIFILLFNDFLFRMLFSLSKFAFAFPNLVDMSLSRVPHRVSEGFLDSTIL